jgi:hypothetical protein
VNVEAKTAVLGVARAMRWVRETGPNRGAAVEAMLRAVHLEPGNPWCAAFVAFIGKAVCGDLWPLPMVGGCATLGEAAQKRGVLRSSPAVGAIFLIYSPLRARFNHTGFLVLPDGGHRISYRTCEGNTSPDGSPEGTGVFERVRTFGDQDRFIHWWIPPTEDP